MYQIGPVEVFYASVISNFNFVEWMKIWLLVNCRTHAVTSAETGGTKRSWRLVSPGELSRFSKFRGLLRFPPCNIGEGAACINIAVSAGFLSESSRRWGVRPGLRLSFKWELVMSSVTYVQHLQQRSVAVYDMTVARWGSAMTVCVGWWRWWWWSSASQQRCMQIKCWNPFNPYHPVQLTQYHLKCNSVLFQV